MSKEIDEKVAKITDKIYAAYGTDSGILLGINNKSVVKAIIKFAVERTTTNLCVGCAQEFATCHLPENCELVFGEGIGNDNVIECSGFVEKAGMGK